jgi:predicted N-acetyltransferase YhbS
MQEKKEMFTRPYQPEDESQVIALWSETVADPAPHNDPANAIRLKMTKDPELFLVATIDDAVVGSRTGELDVSHGR